MKKIVLILVLCLLGIVNLYCEYWNQFDYSKLSESQKLELRERKIQNKRRVEEFNESKRTNWIMTWHGNQEYIEEAAMKSIQNDLHKLDHLINFTDQVLYDFIPFIGLNREELEISNTEIESRNNFYRVIYKQNVKGIQFEEFGEVIVTYMNGEVSIDNSCFPNFNMNTSPSISKNDAWKIAKANMKPENKLFYNRSNSVENSTEISGNEFDDMSEIPIDGIIKTEEVLIEQMKLVFYRIHKQEEDGKWSYTPFRLVYKINTQLEIFYIDAINSDIADIITTVKYGRSIQ